MNITQNRIEELRSYIYQEGNFIQQRCMPRIIKSKFSDIYEIIADNFQEGIYDILHNIENKPKCQECGKCVNFKNHKEGYRRFCSNTCVNSANKKSETFSQKISESKKKKYNSDYYQKKYQNVVSKEGENFILTDGKTVNKNKFTRMSDFDIEDTHESFIINYENIKYKLTEQWIKDYLPNVYNEIWKQSEETEDFATLKYMYINNLTNIPLCKICKNKPVNFSKGIVYSGFNQTCGNSSCRHKKSIFEIEVYEFINSKTSYKIIQNYREDGHEIDIYIPELNLGFECNGLYWHSEIYKEKMYHYNKKIKYLEKGINVFMIWEDDWYKKRKLIESMIMNRLFLNKNYIYARKTKIIHPSKKQTDEFLNENHIQGTSNDSIRLGLEYENKLVAVMTLGKRKFINSSDYVELIRFANIQNANVIGGFSKLLKYFTKTENHKKIISYANLDFSDGNVYDKNGFVKVGVSGPGYFWCKDGVKYHRSNFMKHKLVANGHPKEKTEVEIMKSMNYYRLWNCGNIRYELNIN